MLKIGVIGCGYWGPNLIRNFSNNPDCDMAVCCDKDEARLNRMRALYPSVQTTTNYLDLIQSDLDAVIIATPVSTHFPLAQKALASGKHVFIEKPITRSSAECLALIELAEKNQLTLMVGHTFEYTAAVNKIKEIVDSGEIGEVMYVSSSRVNLGLIQSDINVIWDLAPHDISIISFVLNKFPTSVNASGRSNFVEGIEEVATTSLNFNDGTIAFIHNSWLHPNKIRNMVFVGTKKMLLYDDISQNEKIKIFDKGVDRPDYYDTFGEFYFSYRYGDIYIPRVEEYEALSVETKHFIDCIQTGKKPRSDGYSGLNVVQVLEAADASLRRKGIEVAVANVLRNDNKVFQSV